MFTKNFFMDVFVSVFKYNLKSIFFFLYWKKQKNFAGYLMVFSKFKNNLKRTR